MCRLLAISKGHIQFKWFHSPSSELSAFSSLCPFHHSWTLYITADANIATENTERQKKSKPASIIEYHFNNTCDSKGRSVFQADHGTMLRSTWSSFQSTFFSNIVRRTAKERRPFSRVDVEWFAAMAYVKAQSDEKNDDQSQDEEHDGDNETRLPLPWRTKRREKTTKKKKFWNLK